MPTPLDVLRHSVDRLHDLAASLDEAALNGDAYPEEWRIADVLSHLGSGAVILERRIEDALTGSTMPPEFAPAVWDEWNAKDPVAMRDDGLAADAAATARLESVSDDDRARFSFSMGPLELDWDGFVGLRVNEHAFHTWDVAVALDPSATLADEEVALVVDGLGLIARYTARHEGEPSAVTIRTTDPDRRFVLSLAADGCSLAAADGDADPDLTLTAEAFCRLLYGRLDAAHTPPFQGEEATLDHLRRTFPGP